MMIGQLSSSEKKQFQLLVPITLKFLTITLEFTFSDVTYGVNILHGEKMMTLKLHNDLMIGCNNYNASFRLDS